MINLKSILLFIPSLLLTACSSKYVKVDEQWTWHSYNAGGKVVKKLTVDNATFVIMSKTEFAKDRNKVLLGGTEIKNADPTTFEPISGGKYKYSKDKNHVYIGTQIIINADPATFKILGWPYSKDKSNIFCGSIPMKVSAIDEFVVTNVSEDSSHEPSKSFIKRNPEYNWIDTSVHTRIVVGEYSEAQTTTEKFKGPKKVN